MTGALAGELGSVFVSVVPSLAGAMGSLTAGGSEAADTAISTGPAGPAAAAMAASPVIARAAGAAIAAGGPAGHTVVECAPGGAGGQLVTIECPLNCTVTCDKPSSSTARRGWPSCSPPSTPLTRSFWPKPKPRPRTNRRR
jgi:hypothetical protein